jgi:hypothetical protein
VARHRTRSRWLAPCAPSSRAPLAGLPTLRRGRSSTIHCQAPLRSTPQFGLRKRPSPDCALEATDCDRHRRRLRGV